MSQGMVGQTRSFSFHQGIGMVQLVTHSTRIDRRRLEKVSYKPITKGQHSTTAGKHIPTFEPTSLHLITLAQDISRIDGYCVKTEIRISNNQYQYTRHRFGRICHVTTTSTPRTGERNDKLGKAWSTLYHINPQSCCIRRSPRNRNMLSQPPSPRPIPVQPTRRHGTEL